MAFVDSRNIDLDSECGKSRRVCAFCRRNADFEICRRQGPGMQILDRIVTGTGAERG